MSYAKLKVTKSENSGGGSKVIGKAYIFDWNDVIGGYEREDDEVSLNSNIQFKNGAFIQVIEFTKKSFKGGSKSDGEVDGKGIMQNVEFDHPGKTLEIRQFRNFWKNKDIGIIFQHCGTSQVDDMYGSPCAPLQMNFEFSEDEKQTKTNFKFESTNTGPEIAMYFGTMTLAETNEVDPDDTSIDVAAGNGEYYLGDNTQATAITTLSNASVNGVYTLVGSGGDNPSTIASGGNFLLKNGSSWTGISGAKITFRAFKDGASTWKFVEQSRS